MSSNYFTLTLDTTGPVVNILAPKFTIMDKPVDYKIVSSEQMLPYQNFYIMDSKGVRHDLIFEYLGDSFEGTVDFSEYPKGIATLYVQVKDDVLNLSPVYKHSIRLDDGGEAVVEINDCSHLFIETYAGNDIVEINESNKLFMGTYKI